MTCTTWGRDLELAEQELADITARAEQAQRKATAYQRHSGTPTYWRAEALRLMALANEHAAKVHAIRHRTAATSNPDDLF